MSTSQFDHVTFAADHWRPSSDDYMCVRPFLHFTRPECARTDHHYGDDDPCHDASPVNDVSVRVGIVRRTSDWEEVVVGGLTILDVWSILDKIMGPAFRPA
jgi:hypothetical protein